MEKPSAYMNAWFSFAWCISLGSVEHDENKSTLLSRECDSEGRGSFSTC